MDGPQRKKNTVNNMCDVLNEETWKQREISGEMKSWKRPEKISKDDKGYDKNQHLRGRNYHAVNHEIL